MTDRYIIMETSAQVPRGFKYRGGPRGYRKIAVVEITPEMQAEDGWPKMISEHARGVVRIVRLWERLYEGKTNTCEYGRAMAAAIKLAGALNAPGQGVRIVEIHEEVK